MLEKTRRRPACGVVALVLVSVRFVGGCLVFLTCRLRLLRVLLRLFNVGCWLPEPPVLGLRHLLVQRTGFGVDCRRFLLVLFRGLDLCRESGERYPGGWRSYGFRIWGEGRGSAAARSGDAPGRR